MASKHEVWLFGVKLPYNDLFVEVPRRLGMDRRQLGSWAEKIAFQHSDAELVNNSSTKLGCFRAFLGENQAEKQQKASNLDV